MDSGGIRYDFLKEQGLVPDSTRNLEWLVLGQNGSPVTSFAGWTGTFYIVTALGVDLASALYTKALVFASVPHAVAPILETEWGSGAGLIPRTQPNRLWYEAWRTDTGNKDRFAYGRLDVIA